VGAIKHCPAKYRFLALWANDCNYVNNYEYFKQIPYLSVLILEDEGTHQGQSILEFLYTNLTYRD
jgi:hypothetical protein